MKDTIQLSRAKNVEESFQKLLANIKTKYPDFTDILSEQMVDNLRTEGIEVERVILFNFPHYLMKVSHPYPGAIEHYVLYAGESDYPLLNIDITAKEIEHPRHQTFINDLKSVLNYLAIVIAQRNGWTDYLIVSRNNETLSNTPHIHLLRY